MEEEENGKGVESAVDATPLTQVTVPETEAPPQGGGELGHRRGKGTLEHPDG